MPSSYNTVVSNRAVRLITLAFDPHAYAQYEDATHTSSGVKVVQNFNHKDCIEIQLDFNKIVDETIRFDQLLIISQQLGTRNINVGEFEKWGGCDTCGHGGTHRVTIYARDCTRGFRKEYRHFYAAKNG